MAGDHAKATGASQVSEPVERRRSRHPILNRAKAEYAKPPLASAAWLVHMSRLIVRGWRGVKETVGPVVVPFDFHMVAPGMPSVGNCGHAETQPSDREEAASPHGWYL
jgi:hypothetical protein